MILDSNLIIYAAMPEHAGLRRLIASQSPAVSAVSVVEVLGFHKLTEPERILFESFFAAAEVLPVNEMVVERAVAVRQRHSRKMSLGDALIAATALVFKRKLLTHNIKDFVDVPGLMTVAPLAAR